MRLQYVRVLTLAVVATTLISGCSSFTISKPKNGDIVRLPSKTTVIVEDSPMMSSLVVKADGTNVSSQINSVSDLKSQGDLSLPGGKHTVTAEADVSCWYCSNKIWQASSQTNFCVAAETWPSTLTFTALARGNNLSWAKTSDTTVSVATDTGTAVTRWNLVHAGGLGQGLGRIQSTENSCLCMQSIDAHPDAPIGLAICDSTNDLQLWQAFKMPNKNDHYRFQNFGRDVSSACLTEGPNGVLIQRACLDTDVQLWRIRNNMSGLLVSPFN